MAQAMFPHNGQRSQPTDGGLYRRVLERIPADGDTTGPGSVWSRASHALGDAQARASDSRRWAARYGRASRRGWRDRLISRAYLLVWLLSSLVLSLLCLRVVFRLVSADPLATVVEGVYHASDLLMTPFLGLTELPRLGLGVIDVPALVAIVAYAALAWLLTWLLRGLVRHPTSLR